MLTSWTRTDSINVLLAGILMAALLSGSVLCLLWTYPNDQGNTYNAVLEGWQYPAGGWQNLYTLGSPNFREGPSTVLVGPNSTAQYIVGFQANLPSFKSGYLNYSQSQDIYYSGFGWSEPSSAFPSVKQYAVFSYSFEAGIEGGPPVRYTTVWFTGPQGNLSQTVHTAMYGGTDVFHGGLYGTSVVEASNSGNYTLHFYNPFPSGNLSGVVFMGASSVTFTRPYVYVGIIGTLITASLVILTTILLWRKSRGREHKVSALLNDDQPKSGP